MLRVEPVLSADLNSVTTPVDYPPIEVQIAELKAAGWIHVRRYVWKAPVGGYFIGPHGAWKAMKRRDAVAKGRVADGSDN